MADFVAGQSCSNADRFDRSGSAPWKRLPHPTLGRFQSIDAAILVDRANEFEGVAPVADNRRSVARKLEAADLHRSINRPRNSTQLASVFHGTARRR